MNPSLADLACRTSRHGNVMAVSMMKDEGPFLIEWVAHHIAVGFTDILVYTNDCSDGTDDMLKRMQELGIAEHRENPVKPGTKPQPSAIRRAQDEPAVAASDWVMLFDADEFLCLRHRDGTLDALLDAVEGEGANGIVVTWRIFGSGGIVDWSRAPVTEQYLMAAPPMWNKGWGVKTLFRFDPEIWKLGIHRPKMKNKVLDSDFPETVKWLNGSGRPMEDWFRFRGWRSITRTVGYDWAQMNHYAVKSIDSYAIRRLRGNVNNKADKYNADYWALQDRNEVRDDTMLRYSEARGAAITALLSDPELRRLHEAAVARAEAALAMIKAGPDYAGFVADLQAASSVPITQVSAAPPKPRDPAKIAALMSDVERRVADNRADDKARPRPDRELPPVDLYVRGPVDASAAVALDWHANHQVRLPADPRLFTPQALILIAAGKFQRNLARNLPRIAAAAGGMLEIGAASGFLSLQVRAVHPDLPMALTEADPCWRAALDWIAGENAVAAEALDLPPAGAVATRRPGVLVLGDPDLEPAEAEAMAEAAGAAVKVVIVAGRALIRGRDHAASLLAPFGRAGLTRVLDLDALVGVGLARPL